MGGVLFALEECWKTHVCHAAVNFRKAARSQTEARWGPLSCLKELTRDVRGLFNSLLEQMPKEISKWPRRNGLSARKRQSPMSIDLGLLPLTPQTGHFARTASRSTSERIAWERAGAARGLWGCVASAGQALWGLTCLRALPETPRRCHHFGNLFRHLL